MKDWQKPRTNVPLGFTRWQVETYNRINYCLGEKSPSHKRATGMNRETSRRQFLQLSNVAIFASLLAEKSSGEPMELRKAKDAVDHVVLGVSDLQHGIEWFEQKTGVRA